MTWFAQMNSALEYIENNLTSYIDMRVVAAKAGCSEYHFTRMFSYICNVPLSEYIRFRQLSEAGFELKNSRIRIIDLADKYGYSSPNSFTHAFKAMHGVTPLSARKPKTTLRLYQPVSLSVTIQGANSLKYRIEKLGAFEVFGVSIRVSKINNKCREEIPEFIRQCEVERLTYRIVEAAGGNEKIFLNALLYDLRKDSTFRYMVCLDVPENGVPDCFETQVVPATEWAIFPLHIPSTRGPIGIQSIWPRIFTEWFPNSGYEHVDLPEQERLYRTPRGELVVEAWVPIVKNKI